MLPRVSSPFGGSGSEDPQRSESFGSQPTQYGPTADPSAAQGGQGQYGQSGPQPVMKKFSSGNVFNRGLHTPFRPDTADDRFLYLNR